MACKPKIKTFSCPDIKFPEKQHISVNGKTKRSVDSSHFNSRPESSSSSSSSSQFYPSNKKSKTQSAAAEMKEIFDSIKELSSTTYVGSQKKKYKEDILTKLGAPPVKEQTMPFKMKMGILQGRKKREEKAKALAKESGVVLAKSSKKGKKKSKWSDDIDDNAGPDWNVMTNKGVLHLSKKKLGI